MLSLTELNRAAPLLEALISGHRVQALHQPDATSVVITTYGGKDAGRCHVLFSCRPGCARVSQLKEPPRSTPNLLAFTQYLRAHVEGARVGGVRTLDNDRQLAVYLSKDEGDFDLLLAILGPRSNLFLLDGGGCIATSLRRLADTRSELAIGSPWRSPESRPPTAGDDRFETEPDDRYLRAIEEHYARVERSEAFDELRRRIEQVLRKETKTLDRKLAKIDQNLAEARDASGLEREGELLKSALSRVVRGDREVVVQDFETGESVTITLDPTLTPSENLERLFKRYQKAIRSLVAAGARRDAIETARTEIGHWSERFCGLTREPETSPKEIEAFSEQPEIRKLLTKYASTPAAQRSRPGRPPEQKLGKHTVPNRLMPRRYRSAGGLEVWVGRSAAGNDHLSLRLARGKDLFFHLDGAPGSHVVLRTEGRTDPPAEAVLDACELAVHFSKFKNATRADVHAVPIANVRKPKGAKPGLVSVHGGKTIHLRRTDTRLKRILGARIDDSA